MKKRLNPFFAKKSQTGTGFNFVWAVNAAAYVIATGVYLMLTNRVGAGIGQILIGIPILFGIGGLLGRCRSSRKFRTWSSVYWSILVLMVVLACRGRLAVQHSAGTYPPEPSVSQEAEINYSTKIQEILETGSDPFQKPMPPPEKIHATDFDTFLTDIENELSEIKKNSSRK